MDTYEDPAAWGPEPVRPRWSLALRFVATLLVAPLLCVLWPATAVVLFVVGLFADGIAAVSEGFGRGYVKFTGDVLDGIVRLGSWCVTWPELRHEGDAAYYRARVDKVVGNWTERASAPRERKKARPPVECEIPRRVYRGVGGRYVAEVALAQGWELRPTDVRKEVRLWWSAASHPQDAPLTDTARDS
ncbi:hypothetical protein [Streptomyces rubrogriseus]|uniref:Uncharacterized protein n=1 Tax=Streptomyces rubrogriseus TaxID=194673 RepID=A0A6G3TPG3_9ACTN|nr:hypothetical protein [Streptomyces rubrogriseus]NEC38416.1 hypothetical protein [Streptomyces rubrogriseus]